MNNISCCKKKSGFTLVEILAVMMVVGILALVSLPIYSRIKPRLNLNAEIRDLASDLRYAQQLSVTEQVNYSVILDQNTNQYSIANASTGQIIKNKSLVSGVEFESISGLTSDTAEFNVTGASLEAGTIILINTDNSTSTVAIKPSGYVKIEQ